MVKNGALVELFTVTLTDWNNRQQVMETEAYKDYVKGLIATLNTFKKTGQSGDLDLFVRAEELMVLREKELHGREDSSILFSLNAAITDFAVIKNSVETVRVPAEYQAAAKTHHSKKKTHGVVADDCHEALNSHITRLGNRMSAVGISVPEKNILRQRQANMRTVKGLYIELQRQALGIEAPPKDRSLGR